MKRFLWATPMLFVLMSGSAFADTIIGLTPNDGSGDNFGFLQRGGGVTIAIGGGVAYDFFNDQAYAPGSTLGGSTDVFVSGGVLRVGGNSYELSPLSLGTLFLSSITLPTNGRDFTVPVGVDFSVSMVNLSTNEPVDVSGGAFGKMTFHFFDGSYYADSKGFTTVPEPGTLGLIGTGLIGILALVRKRLRI